MPPMIAAMRKARTRQNETRLGAGRAWHDDLVFTDGAGRPLRPTAVLRRLEAALKRAGLPAVSFHDLRHSAASMMAAQGVAPRVVADVLGHAEVSTTLKLYTRSVDAAMRDAVAGFDRAASG